MSSETHTCIACKEEKDREGFYKKQWKLQDEGRCKPCWDDFIGNRKRPNEADTSSNKKQKNKKQKTAPDPETLKRMKDEREEKRRQYYMTYGVGYEFNDKNPDFHFQTEPLVNESLVGKYKLVLYASDKFVGEDTDGEAICRTARGTMELAVTEWNDKPALVGSYAIDTRMSNGEYDIKGSWGEDTSFSFIEHVTDFDPNQKGLNGFNIFSCNDNDSEYSIEPHEFESYTGPRKYFIFAGMLSISSSMNGGTS